MLHNIELTGAELNVATCMVAFWDQAMQSKQIEDMSEITGWSFNGLKAEFCRLKHAFFEVVEDEDMLDASRFCMLLRDTELQTLILIGQNMVRQVEKAEVDTTDFLTLEDGKDISKGLLIKLSNSVASENKNYVTPPEDV